MQLEVLSLKGVLVSSNVTSVVLPGLEGSFGILPGHTPFVSILKEGKIKYYTPEEKEIEVSGGFVKVQDDVISVCLNS